MCLAHSRHSRHTCLGWRAAETASDTPRVVQACPVKHVCDQHVPNVSQWEEECTGNSQILRLQGSHLSMHASYNTKVQHMRLASRGGDQQE